MIRFFNQGNTGLIPDISPRYAWKRVQHMIAYDVLQAPNFPFQIKASAAPPAGISHAALSSGSHIVGPMVTYGLIP